MTNKIDKKKSSGRADSEYNGWKVLAIFIEGVFGLFNSNKIYPAFIMLFFGLAALVVWRLPDTELATIVKLMIESIGTTKFGLVSMLGVTNIGWIYLFRTKQKLYLAEIDRLSATRNQLMNGENQTLQHHHSSNAPVSETYILPSQVQKK